MRKTSHDGGDSTSITSGFENETRKTSVGIIKTKRNSIKRKVQNFSHESDDTVIEPLLQIDKTETSNRSAKYLLSKSKTDSLNERDNKIYSDNQFEKHCVSKPVSSTGTTCNSNITIHNHMNTNIFGGHDSSKFVTTVKSPILVEINGSKATGISNQTSSIFTTAKIHADSITKTMTPVQVTPLPILSTMEGNVVKAGISPDYSQSKNIEPSTSSNSKSINCLSRSDTGKSDPSTEPNLKNISTLLDSRPLDTLTKAESKFPNKSCEPQNIIVTSVTKIKDAELGNKVEQAPHSSINTISERKSKPSQEQFKFCSKDSFRLRDIETKIEVTDNVILPNHNKSSVTTDVPKDLRVIKKEKNSFSNTGGSMKQLQRQKNAIVEDQRDADIHVKNVSEVDKFTTSTYEDSTLKGKSPNNADIKGKQLNIGTSLTKSKDKVTQSVALKPDADTAIVAAKSSKPINTPVTNTSLTSNMNKESSPESSIHSIHSGNLPIKVDSMKGKKSLENQIDKTKIDSTSTSTCTAKEIALNSTVSVSPSNDIKYLNPDTSKGLKLSSSESHKSLTVNTSLSSNNKITPKSTVSVQPTQATFKSDVFDKGHDAGSSRSFKSGKESSKDDAVKLTTTFVQPSLSLTKVKSDINKGKKTETDNLTKEVDRISSIVVPVKLPVTTNSCAITKVNSTKVLETTSMPKSEPTKVQQQAITTLSDKIYSKSSTASLPHKIVKSETTSTPSVTAISTKSFLPTSTITVTKSNTKSTPASSAPSCTNSVVIKPNTELSNRTLSTTSTSSSTTTTNSTLAKSSTTINPPSKTKSTEKHGKMWR